jgi:hypothetical protein
LGSSDDRLFHFRKFFVMKWMYVAVVMAVLGFDGCAKDATASTSSDTIWIAIVMTWNPVNYTIDKEFSSEIDCWNYYDTGVGESKMLNSYGTQVLDHQGNKPDKEYMKKHRPPHRVYPTRLYKGADGWSRGLIWLTCDIKGRSEGL